MKREVTTKLGRCVIQTAAVPWRHDLAKREVEFTCNCPGGVSGSLRIFSNRRETEARRRIYRLPESRGRVWQIKEIDVDVAGQRRGIGTKLYEKAAEFVCTRGGVLVSDDRVADAHSNDFWKKQVKKGRAVVRRNPINKSFDYATVVLRCSKAKDLSGVPKRKARKR